ncbi:D-alanyl-D-alanine carboxypeptidase family protein, partial [Acinetobacter baumannii]|uniref:D-alanyl-D-alanine carboxypeptidase family protein n=1 Tax=Acinetobacter baumannii TaxID=470 RepID=UPI0018991414|nr:D-alanyl-D-alanine carboxypeptidase [Acinetobacter baumannii]
MDTGQILYEKNPHLKLHPASTTKIMTGILAIENGNLNDVVTVDDETPYVIKGSHIALEPGEKLTLKDLLYALLIESANDSALVIAKHIAGTAEEFAKMMNDKAKELGALNTNFVNPHGLTDENHLTTAYDLSLIARYAMKNETFREIVSNYTYT